MPWPWLCS